MTSLANSMPAPVLDLRRIKPHAKNEFGRLKVAVVCKPTNLPQVWRSKSPKINRWELESSPPNPGKLLAQHERMVNILLKHGVEVIEIPPQKSLHEQTYTRDIGFVVGDKFVKSNLFWEIRKPEPDAIVCANETRFAPSALIEGGDVFLVGDKTVFIGYGPRTNKEGVESFKKAFPSRKVVAFELKPGHLHIDCALPVLDGHAMIYPDAFADPTQAYFTVKRHFEKVEVISENQYASMGGNLQFLDKETMLVGNKEIAAKLRDWGFNPLLIPFNQVHKGGGSYRCSILPLVRDD